MIVVITDQQANHQLKEERENIQIRDFRYQIRLDRIESNQNGCNFS